MRLILILIFLFFPFGANASVLSDAAAALQPGQWTTLTTNSASVWFTDGSLNITDFAQRATWDSVNKKVVFCGGSHTGHYLVKCVYYTDSTNTWTSFALPPGIDYDVDPATGGSTSLVHAWDNLALDSTRGIYYHWQDWTRIFRYDVANDVWLSTVTNQPNPGSCINSYQPLVFFPDIDRLVYFDAQGSGSCSAAFYYNPANGQWTYNVQNFGAPAYSNEGIYSSQGFVMVGTRESNRVYVLHAADYHDGGTTTWTQVESAPVAMTNGNQVDGFQTALTVDPSSGNPLLFSQQTGIIYEYNTGTGHWASKGAGTASTYQSYGARAVLVPIPEYNVIMMIGTTGGVATVYLYKNTAAPSDFAARCAANGVFMCVGFDSDTDLGTIGRGPANGSQYWRGTFNNEGAGPNACSYTQGPYDCPVIDTTTKASGAGSLKFTVPAKWEGSIGGQWFTNFSSDYSRLFGAGQEFWISWRQRWDQGYVDSVASGTGMKQAIIGTGTVTSPDWVAASSCGNLEVVPQNLWHNIPQMYHHCPPTFQLVETVAGEQRMQNARGSPYCLYSQIATNSMFPPLGNCIPFYANEWVTLKVHVQIGTQMPAPCVNGTGNGGAGDYCFTNSHVDYYLARNGATSWEPLISLTFDIGPASIAERYGTLWFTMASYAPHAEYDYTSSTWYDELIMSTQDIGLPSTATTPAAIARHSFGGKVTFGKMGIH